MPYDTRLADRVRRVLASCDSLTEKKMFGGLAFMIAGHMCCGVLDNRLMLRLGKQGVAEALKQSHTNPMDFTGRTITTMVFIEAEGVATDASLERWVGRAVEFVDSLPAKD